MMGQPTSLTGIGLSELAILYFMDVSRQERVAHLLGTWGGVQVGGSFRRSDGQLAVMATEGVT